MNCPNCGRGAADNQKFCRGGGFPLEKVAQLIARHYQNDFTSLTPGESLADLLNSLKLCHFSFSHFPPDRSQ
jgi:hypothetical protein